MLTTACLLASAQMNDLFIFFSLEVHCNKCEKGFSNNVNIGMHHVSWLLLTLISDKQILIDVRLKHRTKLYFSTTALLKVLQERWNEGFLAAQILCAAWSLAPAQSDKQNLIVVVMKHHTKLCLREGVKKNRHFLGKSPKQRTTPTHPYGLGLR